MIFIKHQPFTMYSNGFIRKDNTTTGIVVPSDLDALVPAINDIANEYQEYMIHLDAAGPFKDEVMSNMYELNNKIVFVEVTE